MVDRAIIKQDRADKALTSTIAASNDTINFGHTNQSLNRHDSPKMSSETIVSGKANQSASCYDDVSISNEMSATNVVDAELKRIMQKIRASKSHKPVQ